MPSLFRFVVVAGGFGALGLMANTSAAAAQALDLDTADPVAAAEAHGEQFARPAVVAALPEHWDREPEGTAERLCVDLPRGLQSIRSGQFVIGGHTQPFVAGRAHKIWWKPVNASLEMTIELAAQPMDGSEGEVVFNLADVTTFYTNDTPPRKIPEESFFPGVTTFPSPGRWMVVATSGENWGCFVFHVNSAETASSAR